MDKPGKQLLGFVWVWDLVLFHLQEVSLKESVPQTVGFNPYLSLDDFGIATF